jgi:hypothetical protein
MTSDPRSSAGSVDDTTASEIRPQPMKPSTYAWLAGGGLLVSIGLLLFLVFQADRVVAAGLDHRVFYVLLIPLGLAAGAFAYGAMISTGTFSGRVGPGEVKLTGPVVFAALVVAGGFFMVPNGGSVTLVVRVYSGDAAGAAIVGAEVVLDAGQARSTARTDGGGQAVFAGVGRSESASGVTVAVTADGYESVRRSLDAIPVSGVVEVGLTALPATLIGTIQERGSAEPAVGVILNFASGAAVDTTDEMGNFRVELDRRPSGRVSVIGVRGDTVGLDTEVPLGSPDPIALLFGR